VRQAGWTAVAGGLGYARRGLSVSSAGCCGGGEGFNAPLRRVASISVVIVAAALAAARSGTFVHGRGDACARDGGGPLHAWLAGLLAFPIGVLSLMLAVSAHIGLSATPCRTARASGGAGLAACSC
jgi:hypothetical protein